MKRTLVILSVIIGIVILAFLATYLFDQSYRPEPEVLQNLEEQYGEPHIVNRADEQMLVIRTIGDPSEFGGKAIMKLFNVYTDLSSDEISMDDENFPAPRARWPKPLDTPLDEYEGHWALPAPEDLTELPEIDSADGLEVELITWQQGPVAEILHIGSYEAEMPTINRLKEHVESQGYELVGPHEEEYWNGPSMFPYLNDPDQYYTVIRYRVRKK